MTSRMLLLTLAVWCQGVSAGIAQTASTETVNAGSIGLRSGFDTNPTDTPGGRGSAFVTQTVSYDYLRGSLAEDGLGLKLSVRDTIYDHDVAARGHLLQ